MGSLGLFDGLVNLITFLYLCRCFQGIQDGSLSKSRELLHHMRIR